MAKSNDLVTKRVLNDKIEELKAWVEEKLDETFLRYRDELMTKLDKIVGMMQRNEEERTVISYRVSEHTKQLEDHEERIGRLEA